MDEMKLNINKEFEPYLAAEFMTDVGYKRETKHYQFRFPNGRGASVIKRKTNDPAFRNCGGPEYWELLVLDWRDDKPKPDYHTDITDDVTCGKDDAINEFLKQIKDMPPIERDETHDEYDGIDGFWRWLMRKED